MEHRANESLISRQEKAAKQQEILEKKRRAKAEYNVSSSRHERRPVEHKPRLPKRKKKESNPKIFSRQIKKESPKLAQTVSTEGYVSVSQWFLSICWIKIPVIGFFYALVLAISQKTPTDKKSFARGYLLYRILVLLLSATVMYVIFQVGLGFVDQLLSFVK